VVRCVRSSGICMPNPNSVALIVSEDGQIDKARATRLVIRIKNMGSETLPFACYILTKNLVYPFTLWVTGIKTNSPFADKSTYLVFVNVNMKIEKKKKINVW